MPSKKVHLARLWVLTPIASSDLALQNTCHSLLSKTEKQQFDRFFFKSDKLTYLTAHALLRICLSQHAPIAPDGWVFTKDPNGRPLIANQPKTPDLRFSISHARRLVACMITQGADCGIDVERIGRVRDAIGVAKRFFSAQEADYLQTLDRSQQDSCFTALWTLKEAYIKTQGLGLALPLNTFRFELPLDPHGQIVFHAPDQDDSSFWNFHLLQVDQEHWAAAAIRRPPGLDCTFHVEKHHCISQIMPTSQEVQQSNSKSKNRSHEFFDGD